MKVHMYKMHLIEWLFISLDYILHTWGFVCMWFMHTGFHLTYITDYGFMTQLSKLALLLPRAFSTNRDQTNKHRDKGMDMLLHLRKTIGCNYLFMPQFQRFS